MDIIDMARASGLTVVLDGRIGSEEYQSVCGSVSAFALFNGGAGCAGVLSKVPRPPAQETRLLNACRATLNRV
ncbi:hypothetical protein AB4Y32_33435 [Paraburkholderia phymatum]|uniref:Uncharacterized protein n=1 Tax=Paraburkholderia phymatum TaxID=148447 RepID=A0ACC6UAN8_9BURK